jgi:hypothetical protein
MNATALQEQLRLTLQQRIQAKKLTGLGLAKQTKFEQAYISNFLNRKRSLSLEGMDRILAAQNLSILDLLSREELNKRATHISVSEGDFENVVLTSPEIAAMEPVITREAVRDILKFKKTFLRRLRSAPANRRSWQRFVLIKVDVQDAAGMYPRLLPGATVLIDRQYNILQPYRRNEPNIYAVRKNQSCTIRYVERDGDHGAAAPQSAASRERASSRQCRCVAGNRWTGLSCVHGDLIAACIVGESVDSLDILLSPCLPSPPQQRLSATSKLCASRFAITSTDITCSTIPRSAMPSSICSCSSSRSWRLHARN